MNALVRARPYLVVLDASFGSDLSGLLSVLQGDRALPPDARRAIPTLLLTGPDTPPLTSIAGAGLSPDVMRGIRTVPAGQPLAVETALREALQIAGLSSYAPLAFAPVVPPPAVNQPIAPPPVPAPAARPPDRRPTRILLALAFLALLAVPTLIPAARLPTSTPTAQPPLLPGTQATPATPATSGAPTAALPGTTAPTATGSAASGAAGVSPASPVSPAAPATPLDQLRGLLGPLLGAPPAAG